MDRQAALIAARQMLGHDEEADDILLPDREIGLIRIVLAVQHRWQRVPVGMGASTPVAIDLVAADVAARWLGIIPDARLLNGLTILEREALKIMRAER